MTSDRTESSRWCDGLSRFIRDIGFPAFVACYFLFTLNGKLEAMTHVLNQILAATQK